MASFGRSTSTLIRSAWRSSSSSRRIPPRPNFNVRQSPISPPCPSCERFLGRQLSSMLPLHSAIASSKLVSNLPTDLTISSDGRFANYVSPI
ncbi:hypothetical protein M5689_013000 [Euphorbia peplus]|nr:hypothetical protein M5689_013000 [Euphorbia peplus]